METIKITKGLIHTYTSEPKGFWVNSYVIELPEGLIVIDTQFILSEARKLKMLIDDTQKKILAIFITHPHPDHFNGTGELLHSNGTIPIISTQATLDGIKNIEEDKRTYWKPTYLEDYPDSTVFPNQIVKSGQAHQIGGLEFIIEDIGEGETSNTSLIFLPEENILFGADLAYHRAHPWLIEGHSEEWIKQLETYYQKYKNVSTVLIGHGLPGTSQIFLDQMVYIKKFREMVQLYLDQNQELFPNDIHFIKKTLMGRYPGYEFENLIEMNIQGIIQEEKRINQTNKKNY